MSQNSVTHSRPVTGGLSQAAMHGGAGCAIVCRNRPDTSAWKSDISVGTRR